MEDSYYEICVELPDGCHTLDNDWDYICAIRSAQEHKVCYPDNIIKIIEYKYAGVIYEI